MNYEFVVSCESRLKTPYENQKYQRNNNDLCPKSIDYRLRIANCDSSPGNTA